MIFFYRIYQCLIMAPLMLLCTALTAVVTSAGCALGGGRLWGYHPPRLWSRVMCWLTWVSVEVHGRENISQGTSYVFVANHQGAYDIFSIYGWLGHNFRWMMKRSLERIPLVGWACRKSGQIFVDNSPHGVASTMKAAERQLSQGMSIVVFPEGARTFTGRMGRFKRGAFQLAEEFGLPVVPVTIDGAFDVLPRTGRVPRPGHIRLTIHRPIASSEADVMEQSRRAIASALPQEQQQPAEK
jgi:1-acyl-sn-glycerol-3-phosphate acyltransferase